MDTQTNIHHPLWRLLGWLHILRWCKRDLKERIRWIRNGKIPALRCLGGLAGQWRQNWKTSRTYAQFHRNGNRPNALRAERAMEELRNKTGEFGGGAELLMAVLGTGSRSGPGNLQEVQTAAGALLGMNPGAAKQIFDIEPTHPVKTREDAIQLLKIIWGEMLIHGGPDLEISEIEASNYLRHFRPKKDIKPIAEQRAHVPEQQHSGSALELAVLAYGRNTVIAMCGDMDDFQNSTKAMAVPNAYQNLLAEIRRTVENSPGFGRAARRRLEKAITKRERSPLEKQIATYSMALCQEHSFHQNAEEEIPETLRRTTKNREEAFQGILRMVREITT